MALRSLPAKWAVLRDETNNGKINQHFNTKYNYTGWYSGSAPRYFTNNTQKGAGGGPFTEKPSSYTLITFADFCRLVLGEEPVTEPQMEGRLPKFWAVLGDNSARFKDNVIVYLNKLRKPGENSLVGTTLSYYGFDGEARARNTPEEFSAPVQVLTLDQFIQIVGAQVERVPTGIGARPGTEYKMPVSSPAPITAPRKDEILLDYELLKPYPGAPLVGSKASVILSNFGGLKDVRCQGMNEYWKPIYAPKPEVGDYYTLTSAVPGGGIKYNAGTVHKVEAVIIEESGRCLITLSGTRINLRNAKPSTDEEIDVASAVEINGRRMVRVGDSLQIGGATLNRGEIQGIRKLMQMDGNAKITIGQQNLNMDILDKALTLI